MSSSDKLPLFEAFHQKNITSPQNGKEWIGLISGFVFVYTKVQMTQSSTNTSIYTRRLRNLYMLVLVQEYFFVSNIFKYKDKRGVIYIYIYIYIYIFRQHAILLRIQC